MKWESNGIVVLTCEDAIVKWGEEKKEKPLDWRSIKNLVEVRTEPITCFKIVPDRSVTNYTNYKFFKDIHEIEKEKNVKEIAGAIRDVAMSTVFKKEVEEGFKIVYRKATDYVWYEIIMTEDSINFYVLCYKKNEEFVKLKLEQSFPNAPIEIVDEVETWIPEENTIIADLKLQRHNFFSIHTDYKEKAQPIEDLLMNAEDVKGDDVLKFSMRVQPYDMEYWSYKAEEWEAKMRKGQTPKRIRMNKAGMIGALNAINEQVFQLSGQFFRALHGIMFKKYQTEQIIIKHSDSEAREIGGISERTIYKMTAPVFRVNMRVASHSDDRTRRVMHLKSLGNSFIDVKGTNNAIIRTATYEKPEKRKEVSKEKPYGFIGTQLRKIEKVRTFQDNFNEKLYKALPILGKQRSGMDNGLNIQEKVWKWAYDETANHKITPLTWLDYDYNIMCDRELGKLQQLPTAEVQKKFEGRMDNLPKKEATVPKDLTGKGIPIGVADFKGQKTEVVIPDNNPDEFNLPLAVCGIQGSGKDTFAVNYVYENNKRGRGAIVVDVVNEHERGMADALEKVIPPENLVVVDYGDLNYSPYLDWGEVIKKLNRFTQGRFSSELTKFFEVDDDGAGIETERYLKESAKASPDSSILKMGLLLLSEKLRKQVIEDCKKRGDASNAMFWELYNGETEARQRQIARPILNRLHKLVGDPALKPIFAQKPNGSIDYDKWLSEGKVVIVKIPKVLFGTQGIRTMVHWITVKTWLVKQQQLFEKRKCESLLILNEPHQYFTKGLDETLKELLPESRKTGLQVVTLFHDIAQMPKDMFEIAEQSGLNFILLKQKNSKQWNRFMHIIEQEYTLEDCVGLEKYEAIIGFMIKGKEKVLRVTMNDFPHVRGAQTYDNTEHVKECIKKYGRPIEEIEKEIAEDEMLLMQSMSKKATK